MDVLKIDVPMSQLSCGGCKTPAAPLLDDEHVHYHLVDVHPDPAAKEATVALEVQRLTWGRRADGGFDALAVVDVACPGCKTTHHFSQHLTAPLVLLKGIGRCSVCSEALTLRDEQIEFADVDGKSRVTVRGLLVCEGCARKERAERVVETTATVGGMANAERVEIDLAGEAVTVDRTAAAQLFISYSREDRKWLDRLLVYLAPMRRMGLVRTWSDLDLEPGKPWRPAIEEAMTNAAVAVLLVSPDFLASEFIANHELPVLLDAAAKRGLRIFWIAVSASHYAATEIASYAAAHDPAEPLDSLPRADRGRVMVEICEKIRQAVESANAARPGR